ncbi:unnamed protein product [Rotaria sordida]|uniref:Uncharacterized protein n=1 Tax=Rotaria sordida TaxID=392033 RepID=A0A813VKC9_9BILA|nr:unnamed protein product [Rotaria sordida]
MLQNRWKYGAIEYILQSDPTWKNRKEFDRDENNLKELLIKSEGYWLDLVETLALSFPAINGSSMNYTQYEKAYAKRCSLSPTISVDKIKGYIWMEGLNFYLCMCGMLLAFVAHIWYGRCSFGSSKKSNRLFVGSLYIFIGLVISILCNQLVSAFACRSIDILYDIRFTSIIIVQIVGFIVCLIFAFLLGIKYASLNLQLN